MKRIVSLLLCVLAWPVSANAACPTYRDIESISIARALTEIAPQIEACAEDALATGLYGGLLLRSGQIDTALIWLEKALLLDPAQSGVQADYALALAAQGDRFSSRAIADELLAQDAVPDSVTSVLSELSAPDRWSTQLSASIGTGFSTNTEFLPDVETLDLTFGDDGAVSVPLAESVNPESGALFQQSVRATALWEGPGARVAPMLHLAERRLAGSERADYLSTRFSVAVSPLESDVLLDASYGRLTYGDGQERTEWHRVVFFNRLAEVAAEYLRKGSKVYVEGTLRTRKWQDKQTGQDRYTTEIVGNEMQMLDSRGAGGGGGDSYNNQSGDNYSNQGGGFQSAPAPQAAPAGGSFDPVDDDIPF